MTNYRRMRVEGGTYFFTVALANRHASTLVDHIDLLRASCRTILRSRPVTIDAMVILPDHLHAVWTLPDGDADYSTRWKDIKTGFTKTVLRRDPNVARAPSASKRNRGEKGIWQRRFWEHTIRGETDFRTCVEFCWFDPVKHGLVGRVGDWEFSSFHRDVRSGIVSPDWTGEHIDGEFGEAA